MQHGEPFRPIGLLMLSGLEQQYSASVVSGVQWINSLRSENLKLALIVEGKRICRVEVSDITPELFDQAEQLGTIDYPKDNLRFEYRHVGNEYRVYVSRMKR